MKNKSKKVLAKRWPVDEPDSVDLNWFSVSKTQPDVETNPYIRTCKQKNTPVRNEFHRLRILGESVVSTCCGQRCHNDSSDSAVTY